MVHTLARPREALSSAARFTQLLDSRACSDHNDTFMLCQALWLLIRLGCLEGSQGGCHACVVSLGILELQIVVHEAGLQHSLIGS